MNRFQERIDQNEIFDFPVISHGFAPYMRDYDVVVDRPAPMPDGSGRAYTEGRYCYRFTHCPEARVTTELVDDASNHFSWGDEFVSYDDWLRAGEPDGYVWGTCHADCRDALSYVPNSSAAATWSARLGREMQEILIETTAHRISLVCHDLVVLKIAAGDPATGTLTPLDVRRFHSPYQNRPVTHLITYF